MTDYNYVLAGDLLEIKDVGVSYGGKTILRDCTYTLKDIHRPGFTQGQVVALLAPSGMGKSQLFRRIAGLDMPGATCTGQVYLTEEKTPAKAGMVGVVAQDYPLFAHLTVFDNLIMAAKIKMKASDAADTVNALLERFDLIDRKSNYPHQLSGGQRQRVAIIQQMVCSGHLLLMDEPFSGLDPLMKETVQSMISNLAAANELNSIILTTHDISAAVAVADTVVLLGRDRDENNQPIPGARVQAVINLIDRGLAWRPDIEKIPAFHETEDELKDWFHRL